jgi:hypothetical protein
MAKYALLISYNDNDNRYKMNQIKVSFVPNNNLTLVNKNKFYGIHKEHDDKKLYAF